MSHMLSHVMGHVLGHVVGISQGHVIKDCWLLTGLYRRLRGMSDSPLAIAWFRGGSCGTRGGLG